MCRGLGYIFARSGSLANNRPAHMNLFFFSYYPLKHEPQFDYFPVWSRRYRLNILAYFLLEKTEPPKSMQCDWEWSQSTPGPHNDACG